MRPQYIQLVGTTPVIVPLDNDISVFNVAIRAPAGITVEVTLEDPADAATPANLPLGESVGQTFVAIPAVANANGIIYLTTPHRAIRLTPTAGGLVTVLQQGLI